MNGKATTVVLAVALAAALRTATRRRPRPSPPEPQPAETNGHKPKPRKTLTGALAMLDLLDNQADPYEDFGAHVPNGYGGYRRNDDTSDVIGRRYYTPRREKSPPCDGCGEFMSSLPLMVVAPGGMARLCATCAGRRLS